VRRYTRQSRGRLSLKVRKCGPAYQGWKAVIQELEIFIQVIVVREGGRRHSELRCDGDVNYTVGELRRDGIR
jgi:hypothetical protein